VLSDADTGFGEGTEGVARVVREYSRAGAAGLHLEDQVFPKRCGHLDGKQLVGASEFALKVEAAARARDALGDSFVVCARTDARGVEGLEAAIARAKRYVDAGADMVFPEGLASLEEFEAVAKALRGYNGINGGVGPFLLANMTEWGKTPLTSAAEFGRAGFHCTIFPMTLFRFAMRGVVDGLQELREHGRVLDAPETPLKARMLTREATYELLGYMPSVPWEYPSANHDDGKCGRRTTFRQADEKEKGR
jgi:methylisocitrate lyase